jgi:hypothetical protein
MALSDYEYVGNSHQSCVILLFTAFIAALVVVYILVAKNNP